MARRKLPPRLYFVERRNRWIIRYAGLEKYTPYVLEEKRAAEALLRKYITSRGDIKDKLKPNGTKKRIIKNELGSIYFISKLGCSTYPIKIGFSVEDVNVRLVNLQVANPERLCILAIFYSHRSVEMELHKLLCQYRVLGEWFSRSDEVIGAMNAAKIGTLRAWIDSMSCLNGDDLDASQSHLSPLSGGLGCDAHRRGRSLPSSSPNTQRLPTGRPLPA